MPNLVASGEQVMAALRTALPEIRQLAEPKGTVGYGNDQWILRTNIGSLFAKVGRFPYEPTQVDRQCRAQRWLAEVDFPTPELLCTVDTCAEVDGRRFSVQRYVESDSDDCVPSLPAREFRNFFADLGTAIGRLHSLRLPYFVGWVDYRGRSCDSWREAVRPTDAIRRIHDEGTVPSETLAEIERRIDRGIAALSDVEPRLVHRDIHLGNVLLRDGRFVGLVDFELVKEWDRLYDFNRLRGLFDYYEPFGECERPFLEAYEAIAGELPTSFALRHWLYQGVGAVRGVETLLDGNDGYHDRPDGLLRWFGSPVPL